MFSGIVECTAKVVDIQCDRQNKHFTLTAPFAGELKIDQSVAHNGVCLTVVALEGDRYTVTAMHETLIKSNLGDLKVGDEVWFALANDLTGIILERTDGEWTGTIPGKITTTDLTTDMVASINSHVHGNGNNGADTTAPKG